MARDCGGWHPQVPVGTWDRADPDWAAVLAGDTVRVTWRGESWFAGRPTLTWLEWRRAARRRGSVLLVSGPFASHEEFAAAVRAQTLLLLVAPLKGAGTGR